MSSSMETELLKSGAEGEHTTWKERDRAKWEEKREGCPFYIGDLRKSCDVLVNGCRYESCPFVYWLGMRS